MANAVILLFSSADRGFYVIASVGSELRSSQHTTRTATSGWVTGTDFEDGLELGVDVSYNLRLINEWRECSNLEQLGLSRSKNQHRACIIQEAAQRSQRHGADHQWYRRWSHSQRVGTFVHVLTSEGSPLRRDAD